MTMDLTTPSGPPPNRIGEFAALPVDLDKGPKVHHLPAWKNRDDPTRVAADSNLMDPGKPLKALEEIRVDSGGAFARNDNPYLTERLILKAQGRDNPTPALKGDRLHV